ncbi:uncharacterized protein J4E84_006887 [Alternaria hordeiaustralica]|uniref:uncharacterized protein n=1 Tax=Alternaria hordeiaustralica TaxID=1187925 RepID=UPI0020C2C86F|nr:uncharacterized protein J4E84_006887 [Alternaria hordeiaustralica]KAI4682985.1 hypothetical protein J4E84_006887 [Alternaria hordeiaustralica]
MNTDNNNTFTYNYDLLISTTMKLTALLTVLCASTTLAATNYVLQVDGSIKAFDVVGGDLQARQQFESCCATKFVPPCGCGTDCPSCGVSTLPTLEKKKKDIANSAV